MTAYVSVAPNVRRSTPREDLEWLFNSAESEMGVKSNFSPMLFAMKHGGSCHRVVDGEQVHDMAQAQAGEDAIIEALDEHRYRSRLSASRQLNRVMGKYARMPRRAKVILEAAFEARQIPTTVRVAFGDAALCVRLTRTAKKLRRFSMDWLELAVARGDALVPKLKAEATALLDAALSAYGAQ